MEIKFFDKCVGIEHDLSGRIPFDYDEAEPIAPRLHSLRAVFEAIRQRARETSTYSRVHTISIENLQNVPLPEFTTSTAFKDVMGNIENLHLCVIVELSERGTKRDLQCIERIQFEPYLRDHWLAPFANQLSSLSLSFSECWGIAPGYFDGASLDFPRLKRLHLGEFVISHQSHFEWVLRQQLLTHLRLNRCFIASYMRIDQECLQKWNTPIQDWKQLPTGTFGFCVDQDYPLFSFSGTRGEVFDHIYLFLTQLEKFSLIHQQGKSLIGAKRIVPELGKSRYNVLSTGILPSPWIRACQGDGFLEFGDDEAVAPEETEEGIVYDIPYCPNKAEEHEEGDGRALKRLLEAIVHRKNSTF